MDFRKAAVQHAGPTEVVVDFKGDSLRRDQCEHKTSYTPLLTLSHTP